MIINITLTQYLSEDVTINTFIEVLADYDRNLILRLLSILRLIVTIQLPFQENHPLTQRPSKIQPYANTKWCKNPEKWQKPLHMDYRS